MWRRSGAPSRGSVHRDRGSITVEAAMVLPLLLLVTMMLLWGMSVGFTSLAMGDSVRTAARLIARGESSESVMSRLQDSLPESELSLRTSGPDLVIGATQVMSVPIPVFRGLGVTVTQSAAVPQEFGG